jgi:hypothetical protein
MDHGFSFLFARTLRQKIIRLHQDTLQACWSEAEIPSRRGCRDEWRGDPPKLEERRRVSFGEFRFDTLQLAGRSFIFSISVF